MSGREWADSQYTRIYWTIVDDPKVIEVYLDDQLWATYTRLLVGADQTYPASSPLPRWLDDEAFAELVRRRIAEPVGSSHYRIVGLPSERAGRLNGRTRGGQVRAAMAQRDDAGRFLAGLDAGDAGDAGPDSSSDAGNAGDAGDIAGRSSIPARRDETSRGEASRGEHRRAEASSSRGLNGAANGAANGDGYGDAIGGADTEPRLEPESLEDKLARTAHASYLRDHRDDGPADLSTIPDAPPGLIGKALADWVAGRQSHPPGRRTDAARD